MAYREEPCPVGSWTVDWRTELRSYVKPDIANELEQLIEILEKSGFSVAQDTIQEKPILTQLKDAAQKSVDCLLSHLITR